MAQYRKEIRAGRYRMVTAYTATKRSDNQKSRAEKKNHASKAQRLINERNSRIALTCIIAANFMDSDTAFFVTTTFDNDHYPEYKKTSEYWSFCCNEAKLYMKRLRRLTNNRSSVLRYVYSVGVGECGRWHIHMLIDGVTAEDIRDAWGRGAVDYHNLFAEKNWAISRDWYIRSNNVNPAAIAKYFMHNASSRLVGAHPWHASKNCERPGIGKTTRISDSDSIEPPDGSEILDRESTSLVYSTFRFVEYIEPHKDPFSCKTRGRRKK